MENEMTINQGTTVDVTDAAQLRQAVELAFDYRGDVTVRLKSTGQVIEGYIFDRRDTGRLEDAQLRMMPKDDDAKVTVNYSDIAELVFSGKDTAAGKSFETWVKKYVEKKLKGEIAEIESEELR